ncbi:adenylate/guanylate cyclase domain-containing protein [Limibacillus halophilus]
MSETQSDGHARLLADLNALALRNASGEALMERLSLGLREAGLPLTRCAASFPVLHPLFEANSIRWSLDGLDREEHDGTDESRDGWYKSPFYKMVSDRRRYLRQRLEVPDDEIEFPILKRLREQGGTDYFCSGAPFTEDWETGVLLSFLTDRPGGFTEAEITAARQLITPLSLVFKCFIERGIAASIATTYLGRAAGEAVLQGSIRRGDGRRIEAALWYSDLRGSSALAEQLPAENFLERLNAHFDIVGTAVREAGGESVSFIGDALLAYFPAEPEGREEACRRALAAARKAQELQAGTRKAIPFSVALHYGSFVYGNIGTADRLQFTVIGAAINELARLQEMTKTLGEDVLLSGDFVEGWGDGWRGLGSRSLRGIERRIELFAPCS